MSDSIISSNLGGNKAEDDGTEEEHKARQQYRVIKKDLLFRVNFQQNNNKYRHGED